MHHTQQLQQQIQRLRQEVNDITRRLQQTATVLNQEMNQISNLAQMQDIQQGFGQASTYAQAGYGQQAFGAAGMQTMGAQMQPFIPGYGQSNQFQSQQGGQYTQMQPLAGFVAQNFSASQLPTLMQGQQQSGQMSGMAGTGVMGTGYQQQYLPQGISQYGFR
ncbi:hypothetical protein [Desulfurispora thermophila]|uniref:hypothetical protein n=1 Tax=Desulfurispora thermophila TaxID=265470 RepID=UPI00036F425D|nr:hypothetical protein [Desulfurispora thermophila]